MFTGFTDETVDFMWGIRFNNERAWFEAHKEIYLTHFYQPMRELGDELYDYIAAKRPDLGLIRKVTRIYRDVRRLHGRGPYKESLWFSIEQPSEEWTAHPTFWFELMPEGWTCGMGYYMPKPLTMAKLRARIDRDPAGHGEADAEAEPPEGTCPGDGGLQAPQGPGPFQTAGALVPGQELHHLSQ